MTPVAPLLVMPRLDRGIFCDGREEIARSGAGNDEREGEWGLTVASSFAAAKRIARSGAGNDERVE